MFSVLFLWVFPFVFWCFLVLFMIPGIQDSDTNVSYIPEEASDMSDNEESLVSDIDDYNSYDALISLLLELMCFES